MHIRLIPLAQVTQTDAEAWRRLADRAVEPNVYLDPRFLVPARARVEAGGLQVVVVEELGEWLAALAVTTKPVARRAPGRAAATGGAFMTLHSDRHHPLVRGGGRVAEVLEALLHGMTSVGLPGLVQLQRFPSDGVLAEALATAVGRTPMLMHERRREVTAFARRSSTPVPADQESTVSAAAAGARGGSVAASIVRPALATDHMPTDERRNMRRCVRGLERATGGPLELHDLSADPAADDEFLDLQASGWKGDGTQGGAALRLDPPGLRWFREVVSQFREDGDLHVIRLAAGGQTLWIGYGLRSGGAYFGFLDAYAEDHARYSPGSIGRIAAMTHVFGSTDAPFFDPAFEARYSTGARIFPDRREQVDLLVSTKGLAARSVLRAAPLAQRLSAHASRAPGLHG
ncbi:GNAT family N-acetyltransferase [Cellulomonas timonensis]|uniref:GNAT family N-acetyltransferase n=1 Tax=Cellulomonas timonensis TaxID=1689271 RepID=UPI0011C858D8|nr:GNAT family N-acetyltransferase [Cellulomonas timonensis]